MPLTFLPNGTYEARYYEDGTKKSRYVRENFGEVTRDEAEVMYQKRRTLALSRRMKKTHLLVFQVLAQDYLEVQGLRMSDGGRLRAEQIIRLYLNPVLGAERVDEITADKVERLLNGIVIAGKSEAARAKKKATANRVWNALRAILRWGLRKKGAQCPALGNVSKFSLPNHGVKEIFFEQHEWRRFVTILDVEEAFCEAYRQQVKSRLTDERVFALCRRLRTFLPLYDGLLYTGARLGDILDLRWRQVDFKSNRITFKQKKTGATVVLPIGSRLRATLRSLGPELGTDRHVFRRPDGRPWLQGEVREAFIATRRAAGLSKNLTPHALRHTLGSWLAMAGYSLKQIQQILGHATIDITARHYAHLLPESLEGAINYVDEIGTGAREVRPALSAMSVTSQESLGL